jgi:peptide/nickel transport system permease protein
VRYVAARSLHSLLLALAGVATVFLLVRLLPGDPITAMVGDFPTPPGYADEIRKSYGLDQPLPKQFGLYVAALAHGDLGFSFKNQQPVSRLLVQRGLNTLLLGGSALVLGTAGGILLGLAAAARRDSLADKGICLFAAVSYAAPVFWVGQLLILALSVRLGVLPVSGMSSLRSSGRGLAAAPDVLYHLVLPVIVLALPYVAIQARIARVSMAEALGAEYVKTANAKGLSHKAVLYGHAFRNALLPMITVAGLEMPLFLAGSALVETVFSWPGLGRLLFDSIASRDYPVIEGILLCVTFVVIAANWTVDLLYGVFDPRIGRV